MVAMIIRPCILGKGRDKNAGSCVDPTVPKEDYRRCTPIKLATLRSKNEFKTRPTANAIAVNEK